MNVADSSSVISQGANGPSLSDTWIVYVAIPAPSASSPAQATSKLPVTCGGSGVTVLVGTLSSIVLTTMFVSIGGLVSKTIVAWL